MILDTTRTYSIAETLPHRGRLVLLDELLEYGQTHARCALTIREDSLFQEPGHGVPAWVALEYLAQTIAVYGGILRLQMGRQVQVALLLGTRVCDCDVDYFATGQRLLTRVELVLRDDGGVGAFVCELRDGSDAKSLMRADIKAYQPDDIEDYFARLAQDKR